ncbi:CenpB-DNA-bind-domain-containing protein [Lentinus tigrinus ALCF2SS1-7]|uniref:CenpB-DNA-bind-domain-containing protein n=1 Tax=Lentinus tigrinus ALCF2SS1-6 TaxID=1328759 RepID=A0A5C2SGD6_9APHY|nr:CenpB-DNA-bind-domain-containing protein [Lentinus tigrinus ALCF2SS1-6]RPD77535.1 CenpB-DNA-bind-domain-containing protein [Lentinus tigrinus ALCF2SS1-7]
MNVSANENVSIHHWRRYFPAHTYPSEPGPSSQPRPPQPTQPPQPIEPVRPPSPPITIDDSTVDENAPDTSAQQPRAAPQPRSPSPPITIGSSTEPVPEPGTDGPSADAPPGPLPQPSTSGPKNGKGPMRKHRLFIVDKMHEEIAVRFGVERSTISKILKQRHRWAGQDPDRRMRDDYPKHRPGKFPDLELRLEEWTKLACKNGNPVSDVCLRKKARAFADEMGITADKFKASSGWVENFKHRVGIRRGFYVGNGTAEAAVAAVTAPGLAPTILTPPMPTVQSSLGQSTYAPQSSSRAYEAPLPHPSVSLSPPSSQPTWSNVEQQPSALGESPTVPDAYVHSTPEQGGGFEYQPTTTRSPSAPATVDHPEMPPTPPLATSTSSEPYIHSDAPVPAPPLDDQPIRTLKDAEEAFKRFLTWATRDEETLTVDELQYIYKIRYKLFDKVSGVIS